MKVTNPYGYAIDVIVDGDQVTVEAGGTVEVPTALGRSLVKQGWTGPKKGEAK